MEIVTLFLIAVTGVQWFLLWSAEDKIEVLQKRLDKDSELIIAQDNLIVAFKNANAEEKDAQVIAAYRKIIAALEEQ